MSEKLTKLRTAIEKLDEAEKACWDVVSAYRRNRNSIEEYRQIDNSYKSVGAAATTLRHFLEVEEKQALHDLREAAKIPAGESPLN